MNTPVILRICSSGLYKKSFSDFFTEHKLSEQSYENALQEYRNYGFMYPSGFKRHMADIGYEVREIVSDVLELQQLWWKQKNKNSQELMPSLQDIFFQQIKEWEPDIVYFQDVDAFSPYIRGSLKKKFPSIKILTGFKGFPPHVFTDYTDFDLLFIPYPAYKEQWDRAGIATHYLPHCFDPGDNAWNHFQEIQKDIAWPCVFIGSSGYGNANQQRRYELLEKLLRTGDLEIWGLEQQRNILRDEVRTALLLLLKHIPTATLQVLRKKTEALSGISMLIRDAVLVQQRKIPVRDWYVGKQALQSLFPNHYHAPIFGSEYMNTMSQALVTLNIHTDMPGESGNIRTFEATGSGSCLLVDERQGLEDLFVSGSEIVTYKSDKDCRDQLHTLLANPSYAREIAQRGHDRAMKDHTSKERCSVIDPILRSMLP